MCNHIESYPGVATRGRVGHVINTLGSYCPVCPSTMECERFDGDRVVGVGPLWRLIGPDTPCEPQVQTF